MSGCTSKAVLVGGLLAPIGKPFLHHRDLAFLSGNDILRQFANLGVFPVFESDLGHINGALVVRDHAAHEIDVGIAGELDLHIGVHLVVRRLIIADNRVI